MKHRCNCDARANFRAEPCKKCGEILNGNDPMSCMRHLKICKPSKKYKDKLKKVMKDFK